MDGFVILIFFKKLIEEVIKFLFYDLLGFVVLFMCDIDYVK